MLTDELNEMLTRVGPGTAMGGVFRRFWLPAITSVEIDKPDSPPVRLRILGEDLIAFRDTAGKVGILEAYCSHRLAPLFFGRNEECGLRCAYHGWKFDVNGKCVDMPNAPAQDAVKARSRANILAYPTREAGGIVWVFMGPKELEPPMPGFEWLSLPSDQVHVSRWLQRTNYSVGMEGEIDSAHISFLHKEFAIQDAQLAAIAGGRTNDGAPQMTLRDTDYGFTYGARRAFQGNYIWRQTHWIAPMFSLIPMAPGEFVEANGRAWVPIDDNHTTTFCYSFRVDRPLGADKEYLESGAAFPPRMVAGRYSIPGAGIIDTFLPASNRENDFLVDRTVQKTKTFTGIWGANDQDRSLQESLQSMGPSHPGIVNRRREHLMVTDLAIVSARNKLLKMAADLRNGVEPNYPKGVAACKVRAISKISAEADFDRFAQLFSADIYPTLPQNDEAARSVSAGAAGA